MSAAMMTLTDALRFVADSDSDDAADLWVALQDRAVETVRNRMQPESDAALYARARDYLRTHRPPWVIAEGCIWESAATYEDVQRITRGAKSAGPKLPSHARAVLDALNALGSGAKLGDVIATAREALPAPEEGKRDTRPQHLRGEYGLGRLLELKLVRLTDDGSRLWLTDDARGDFETIGGRDDE